MRTGDEKQEERSLQSYETFRSGKVGKEGFRILCRFAETRASLCGWILWLKLDGLHREALWVAGISSSRRGICRGSSLNFQHRAEAYRQ